MCEHAGCNQTIPDLGFSHSFIVVYATTGIPGVAAQQCPAEQHYACCTEHARAVMQRCFEEHLLPQYQAEVERILAHQQALADQQRNGPQ